MSHEIEQILSLSTESLEKSLTQALLVILKERCVFIPYLVLQFFIRIILTD